MEDCPTTNGGMQDGSSVRICKCCIHVLARFKPICMLSRCLLTKFLHRSSVGSLLRVRCCCWLGSPFGKLSTKTTDFSLNWSSTVPVLHTHMTNITSGGSFLLPSSKPSSLLVNCLSFAAPFLAEKEGKEKLFFLYPLSVPPTFL